MEATTPSPVRILAIDDSPTQLAKLQFVLEGAGYSVITATDGQQGLAAANANSVDLVISDIIMPELDGYGLCKALKNDKNLQHIPVILLTALVDAQDVILGLEAGATNFIRKPFDRSYLLARVENVLANAAVRGTERDGSEVTIRFRDRAFELSPERLRALDLMLSTYDDVHYQLPHTANTSIAGAQVLVVGTSQTQAERIRFELEELGCNVLVATRGAAALTLLQTSSIDLVISDILLPDTDGFTLCKAIRADSANAIPVVLLGSLEDPLDVIAGLEAGVACFMRKTSLDNTLALRVRNLIVRRRTEVDRGLEIVFGGRNHTITADRRQMLDLLLSSYDNAVHQNIELERVRDALRDANDELETRAAALAAEIDERKRAQHALDETNRDLEEKNREVLAKGQALQAALAAESAARQQVSTLLDVAERQAVTDSLTGVGNRRAFIESGERLIGLATRHRRQLSLVLFDIDFFKAVNDQYGHPVGDRVLVGLVESFLPVMRATDVFCRWGGEEFVALLPETDVQGAMVITERLRAALSARVFEHDGQTFTVSASAGVAQHEVQGDSLEALLKRADQALYQAKTSGRNRALTWRPGSPPLT